MMKRLFTAAIALCLFTVACKKDKKPLNCTLTGITDSAGADGHITIENGKVTRYTSPSDSRTFVYKGNVIIVTTTNANRVQRIDSVVLNEKDLITAIYITTPSSPDRITINRMYYSDQDEIQMQISTDSTRNQGNPRRDTFHYKFEHGNLARLGLSGPGQSYD